MATATSEQLQTYLLQAVPILLAGDITPSRETLQDQLESHGSLLQSFIKDSSQRALFVLLSPNHKPEGNGEASQEVVFKIQLDLEMCQPNTTGVGFIKHGPILRADKSMKSQLQVMNFGEGEPFETIHSYIKDAVTPYFNSCVVAAKKAGEDNELLLSPLQQKMNELETGFLRLQQNTFIPEVTLSIHPTIQSAVARSRDVGRKPTVDDVGAVATESGFLNDLQKCVNQWVRDMQKVTKIEREASYGTTAQEISFWINLEAALRKLHATRHSPEVELTLEVLKAGRRFHATVSFDVNTGLKGALDKTIDYHYFVKDFPIDMLLGSTTLEALKIAIHDIFRHFLRKLRNTSYPTNRVKDLLETVCRDFTSQMITILRRRKLLAIAYKEFEKIADLCSSVFVEWDDDYDKLVRIILEINKKRRSGAQTYLLPAFVHRNLSERLKHLQRFREYHEGLKAVVLCTFRSSRIPPGGVTIELDSSVLVRELESVYESVKSVDYLDLTPEGTLSWEAAVERSEQLTDRIESHIAMALRDQLGRARSTYEMFCIFKRFSSLLLRDHVRGAVREYQTQLLQWVKRDVDALQNKFKIHFLDSHNYRMSAKLDFPPVASAIIWARMIDRKLETYLQRVETVLGKDWGMHVEGQKLKQDVDVFVHAKLGNSQLLYDKWKRGLESKSMAFVSKSCVTLVGGQPRVNFPAELTTFVRECRNMRWLGFRVPFSIVNLSNDVAKVQPFAISLSDSLQIYDAACRQMNDLANIPDEVLSLQCEVQEHIEQGYGLSWESYKLEFFVQQFTTSTINFETKVVACCMETVSVAEVKADQLSCSSNQLATHERGALTSKFVKQPVDSTPTKDFFNSVRIMRKATANKSEEHSYKHEGDKPVIELKRNSCPKFHSEEVDQTHTSTDTGDVAGASEVEQLKAELDKWEKWCYEVEERNSKLEISLRESENTIQQLQKLLTDQDHTIAMSLQLQQESLPIGVNVSEISKELEQLKHNKNVLEEEVKKREQALEANRTQSDDLLREDAHLKEELVGKTQQVKQYSKEVESLKEELAGKTQQVKQYSKEVESLKEELAGKVKQYSKQVEALKQQVEASRIQNRHLQDKIRKFGHLTDELAAKTLQLNTLGQELEASRIRNYHLLDEVKDFRDHVHQLGEQINDGHARLERASAEATGLKEELAGKTEEVEQYSKQVDTLTQQMEEYRVHSEEYEGAKLKWAYMEKEFDATVSQLHQQVQAERASTRVKFDPSTAMGELAHYRITSYQPLKGDTFSGSGSYGSVHRVLVNNIPCIAKRILDILVGREREEAVSNEQKRAIQLKFQNECILLSRMRHPNIVQFMGVHYNKDPLDLTLIMEFLPMDLEKCLKNHPNLLLPIKISILLDVSYGLLHLHNAGIIHRDLSAANVLLTPDMRAKITDLGVSKIVEVHPLRMTKQSALPGALGYMPPEALWEAPQYGMKLDIFSFGVVALFVAVEQYPQFYELAGREHVDIQIKKRLKWIRMLPKNGCNCLHNLICECLQDVAAQRPTTERLNIMLKQLSQDNPRQFTDIVHLEEKLATMKEQM